MGEAEQCEEYFGPALGNQTFYQFNYENFQLECLSKNSTGDATGKRLYSGGHVGIRFLSYLKPLLQREAVLELGCGTGIIGLSLFMHSDTISPSKLVLTDGSFMTLPITAKNRDLVVATHSIDNRKISIQQLLWGSTDHMEAVIRDENQGRPFDIIIGFELMYYNTDLPLLFQTLHQLMHPDHGIFIHVHHFRRDQQERELLDLCHQYQWITVEVSTSTFIDEMERKDHPEWYHMRALITGKADVIHELLAFHNIPYFSFQPELMDKEVEDHDSSLNSTLPVTEHEGLVSLFQV